MTRNRLSPPRPLRRYGVRRGASGKWIVCRASQAITWMPMTRAQAQAEADWRNRHEAETGRRIGG